EGDTNLSELGEFMKASEDQLLIFSGDLSFLNLSNEQTAIYDCIEDLVERDVSIKVLCRVDLVSYENVQKMLELNFKHGKDCIEIRHREQPVRGFVSDSKRLRLKEIKEPTGDISDLNQKVFLFYTIKDREWSEWMAKNFWNMFSESISSDKRIEEIKKLRPG
ncbi:MAG: hypothetical protein SVV03_06545, partial [Candidatus Nanohaloarchaea archaeon]|nr:hypothetical protein [Candidatus Nanohaloarchaea archaeon]